MIGSTSRSNAYNGQSLQEYCLIAGLMVIAAAAGLSEIRETFFSKASEAAGILRDGGANFLAAQGEPGANQVNNALDAAINPGGAAVLPTLFESQLSEAERNQLTALSQQNAEALDAIKSKQASPEEAIDWGTSKAQETYAAVQELQDILQNATGELPHLGDALATLVKSGKLLSATQMSIAQTAYFEKPEVVANNYVLTTHEDGVNETEAVHFINKVASETGEAINGFDGSSEYWSESLNPFYSAAQSAMYADAQAQTFNEQYAKFIQFAGQLHWNLNDMKRFERAGATVLANAGIFTTGNAFSTYANTVTAGTTAQQALR